MCAAIEMVQKNVLFIGSMVLDEPDRFSVLKAAAEISAALPIPTMPQEPQLRLTESPNIYSMDPEALNGLPFFQITPEGGLVYDLVVHTDRPDAPILAIEPEQQDRLDLIRTEVAAFVEAVQIGDTSLQQQMLSTLVELHPDLAWHPEGLDALVDELRTDPRSDLTIKLELSGPINTTMSIATRDENGNLIKENTVLRNETMLKFHAGLLLARSFLWTDYVRQSMADAGKQASVIFSFDEPVFESLDQPTAPVSAVAESIYQYLWSNPDALPYERMVHVCGSFVPWLLKHVDYLNFDVKQFSLMRGHESALQEYIKRGGHLVPGVVYTSPDDIIELVKTLQGSKDTALPFELPLEEQSMPFGILYHLTSFYQDSEDRLNAFLRFLHNDIGLSDEEIRHQVYVSPQCGLGGLVGYIDQAKPSDRPYVQLQAEALTKVVYDHTQKLGSVVSNF